MNFSVFFFLFFCSLLSDIRFLIHAMGILYPSPTTTRDLYLRGGLSPRKSFAPRHPALAQH